MMARLGHRKSRGKASLFEHHVKRRLSRLVLPSCKVCTILPEFASVDGLLHQKGLSAGGLEKSAAKSESQVCSRAARKSLASSPKSDMSSRSPDFSNISSPAPLGDEINNQEVAKWHLLLLGRTFKDKKVQDVARCLAEALDMEASEALQKATRAKSATALVVASYQDAQGVQVKAQNLRKYGLRVQVASEIGVPLSVEPSLPESSCPKIGSRRASYADVFKDAKGGRPHSRRRPMPNRTDVALDDTAAKMVFEKEVSTTQISAPRKHSKVRQSPRFRQLIEKHRQRLAAFMGRPAFGFKSPKKNLLSVGLPAMWDDCFVVLDLDAMGKSNHRAKAEASAVLRLAVFGEIPLHAGYRTPTRKDVTGTKDQLCMLLSFWRALDDDQSELVDLAEFRECVEHRLCAHYKLLSPEELLAMPAWAKKTPSEEACNDLPRFISRLSGKVALHLFGKKSLFSLEDLMKMIWIHAGPSDVQTMKACFREISEEKAKVKVNPPPVLDKLEYHRMCEVFKFFDVEHSGKLSLGMLVSLGIIYVEQVEQTRHEWDSNGDGVIDMFEFCEMMCPLGFRATQQSLVGTLEDGRRVVYNSSGGYWQLDVDHDYGRLV
jgi:hypothetical protein